MGLNTVRDPVAHRLMAIGWSILDLGFKAEELSLNPNNLKFGARVQGLGL